MPNLDMDSDICDFNQDIITKKVMKKQIGNYALGYYSDEKGFVPKYEGRSDVDLETEIASYLETKKHHKKFMYSYADTSLIAYKKECENFHSYEKQLENVNHPASPSGSNATCDKCGK